MDTPILADVTDNWWILAVRGGLAVLFAITAFLWPGLTLAALVLIWGIFALVDGIGAIVAGVRARLWSLVAFGIIAALAGLYALISPAVTALALIIVIGAWAIARGIFEIVAAVRLREELTNEWLLVFSGVASVLLGMVMLFFPGAGALSLVWLIGIQALVVGILMLGLAFRLRRTVVAR
jgi:uncharacterized membrane protein HdeD (DUF308 family)